MRSRRFSKSRRSSTGKKRRTSWSGGKLSFNNIDLSPSGLAGYNAADIIVAWSGWPGGTVFPGDTSSLVNFASAPSLLQPPDSTLVRSLLQGTVTYDKQGVTQASLPCIAYFGIMAWDSQEPLHEAGAILEWPEIPHPADPTQEWLIRVPFPFTQDNVVQVIGDATWINSRAMRKLPNSTGLLMCFGYEDLLTIDNRTWTASFDVRHLFKAGHVQNI